MMRYFAVTIGTFACLVALAVAQDNPPAAKKAADGKQAQKNAPDAKKDDGKDEEPAAPQEDPKKIIERLKENFEKSRKKLEEKDPGQETRKTQKQILEDIDKLLDQQNNDQGGGGGGGGGGANDQSSNGGGDGQSGNSGSQGGKSGSSGQQGGNSGKTQNQGGSEANNQGGSGTSQQNKKQPMSLQDEQKKNEQSKGGGKNEQKKDDQAKGGGKDNQKKEEQERLEEKKRQEQAKLEEERKKEEERLAKKNQKEGDPKDGKNGGPKDTKADKGGDNPGGGNNDSKEKNTIADLYKNGLWGHLPENRRKEMDAFARERFMPRYEELLRAYYRTIAEGGRNKDGN